MAALSDILDQLAARSHKDRVSAPYFVPGLWIDGQTPAAQSVNPFQFYHARLSEIALSEPQPLISGQPGGDWSHNAIIYNMFPRMTTAFDHAADGKLAIGPNAEGWRETGTLLKSIAILPYIRGMGFNTIHLLPITSVGHDGKKGNLGSPYAIRNPYRLDENLDEPALGLSAEQLFAGFVEAAHRLGMRVIMEFVLRTSSKDGDWICEHPDWYYWIRADVPDRAPGSNDASAYGTPIFAGDALWQVKSKVGSGDLRDLPPPPDSHRAMFTAPPHPGRVELSGGRYIGTLEDGTRVRIPGAFSDWPPDDNQPPWGDVTYTRMYAHPDFNYIAYNTIRMYDERLARPENRNGPLWKAITGVIPYYQTNFGIDGVMIDMGHALPMPLKLDVIAAARAVNPDFAFWDESFTMSQQSRDEGYNAVMGYWLFDVHQPNKVREILDNMSRWPQPIRFFAAPENHNTPRAASRPGGLNYARYALAVSITIPGMPFILSGFELGETQPINTGLGFSNEMLAQYPSDSLPLFSAYALNWAAPENLVADVRQAMNVRRTYQTLLNDDLPSSFAFGYSDNPDILVYRRRSQNIQISVIANTDALRTNDGRAVLESRVEQGWGVLGAFGEAPICDETYLNVSLSPGQVILVEQTR